MGDCPKCGLANVGAVDFCPNPQCRTYLGWASAAAPPRPADQQAVVDEQPTAAAPAQPTGQQVVIDTQPTAVAPPQPTGQQPTAAVPRQRTGPPRMQQPKPPAPAPPMTGPPAGPPQKRGVRVTMEPTELTVDPGSQVTTTVTVLNLGTRVEEFQLIPQGPGAAFASITPDTLSIYPDLEQRAVVRFAPPRGPQSLAGITTFEVVARSVVHVDVSDVARGQLTITPFENLSAVLTPDVSRGRKPARHQVSVTNGGNTPVNTRLAFKDQDKALTFEPQEGTAALQPGATTDVPVLINGPHRWIGRTERLPFTAVVTPSGTQPPITLNGTRQQTALFPWWIPTAALAVVAIAIALFALLRPGPSKVPVIGQLDEPTAVQLLKDEQYLPESIPIKNNDVPQGHAIRTEPAEGSELAHGQRVKLFVSAGKCDGPCPQTIEMPNVVGLSLAEAQAKLEQRNFTIRTVKATNDAPVDQVIASDPTARTQLPPGSEVLLTLSSGPKEEKNPAPNPAGALPVPAPPAQGQGGQQEQKPPPPKPIKVPDLKNRSVDDATAALKALGLTAKTVTEHSNAVADGKVLSTKPAADAEAKPGEEVTLTAAQNTAPIDLIKTAAKATWTNGAEEKLTFPGDPANDTTGFVLVQDATLPDGTPTKLLATHPQGTRSITGEYTLAKPVVPGDHVLARVGLLKPKPTDAGSQGAAKPPDTSDKVKVTFVVSVNGKDMPPKVISTADGKLTDLDVDLSTAKGATSIEITVRTATSSTQYWAPVWHNLRLAPQIGG
jgi:beta-lactam-binding protein with PASTA domain